jgi:hypothetical protein
MSVMKTSHQDLATCIYNHMTNKNLSSLTVFVLVSLLPCRIFPFNIIPHCGAPRLTSRMYKLRITARIGEEGQSYQCQSHAGFHLDDWSGVEAEVAAGSVPESQPVSAASLGVFFRRQATSAWSEDRTCVSLCPNDDCPRSFSPRQPTLLLPPKVSAVSH